MNFLFDFTPVEVGGAYSSLLHFIDYAVKSHENNFLICINYNMKKKIKLSTFGRNLDFYVSDIVKKGLMGKWYWYNREIVKLVSKKNIDYAFFPLGVSSKKLFIPTGTIIRQALPYCNTISLPLKMKLKMFLIEREFKKSIKKSTDVFVQTKFMKKIIESKYNINAKVVPWNIVDYEKIKQIRKIKFYRNKDDILKVFYPVLPSKGDYKNVERLLLAIRYIIKNSGKCELILTFDKYYNKEAKRLCQLAQYLGIEDNVKFVGVLTRNDMFYTYSNVDILVFPSLCESFGVPLLEAMAFGKIILASDLAFAHDVCGESAIYFNPYDPKNIAESIEYVMNNNYLRSEMIKKSIETYELKYSKVNIWDYIINLISLK